MGRLFSLILFVTLTSSVFSNEDIILKEAKKAFSKKAYMEAIKKFTKYTELHPSDGEAFMYMGYIYEYKKDYPRSIQNFRKAAELNLARDQKKTVLLKLALFFNYHQDWNLAASYSARYLKYDSKNEEMQKIYNRSVGNHGNPTSNVSRVIPQKHVEEIKPIEKSTVVKHSIQDENSEIVKASTEYEQELALNPNNEELRWEYCLALFAEKKYDLAENNIKILIEKNPARSRYHYKLGIVKLRKEDPKSAIESFEKARKNPFSKDTNVFLFYVYLNEGIAYRKLNLFEQAESSFKSAYKELPKDIPLLALARLYHGKSDWKSCAENADGAVKISDQIESHMFRFVCLAESGSSSSKLNVSFEKYFTYLESNFPLSQQVPEKFIVGFLRLARHLTSLGKEALAEKYFSVLENDPEVNQVREYLFYRGKNLFYLNQLDTSITLLKKVPNSSAAYYLLARAYAKKNDINQLKTNLKSAGSMKDEYWEMAKTEADFSDYRKDTKFNDFIIKKGE